MPKICDNKSVGVIIRANDKFLVILRKNYPIAYAFVAGHLDGDTFEDAAKKETEEEVGITVETLEIRLEEKFSNPCKREGGSWHEWQVFEATKWSGKPKAGSDAKEFLWISQEELEKLKNRTFYFVGKYGIPPEKIAELTEKMTNDPEWQKDPGLEPIWFVMLGKIGIL